jgi:hypothetical protein
MVNPRIVRNSNQPEPEGTVSQIALWLANTLNCVADGLLATNSCGEVLFMNSRAEQITGCPVEEALRQSSSRIFHVIDPVCGTRLDSPLRDAYVEEQVFRSNECLLVAAAGERIPIDFSASPIRTGEGEVVGAVVLFRERANSRHNCANEKSGRIAACSPRPMGLGLNGMLTSVDARRRWFGAFFLILAGGMLAWGLTFLEELLLQNPALFIAYWLTCFGLTILAFGIALYDVSIVRRRMREERRSAFKRAFRDVAKEESVEK